MPSTTSNGYDYWLLLVILASGTLSFFTLQNGHDWGGDYALYVNQAQRIVDGGVDELRERNTYSMLNSSAMSGPSLRIGPFLYPWGVPLLLAPIYALFGDDIQAMKLQNILFLMLSLWVTHQLFRASLGGRCALALTTLLAFCPPLLLLADTVGSDLPFLFFALWAMLFIQKMLTRRYWISPVVTAAATGLIICFAFLIRTNGIFLLGSLGFSQLVLYRNRIKTPVAFLKEQPYILIPYVSFGLCALLVSLLLPGGSGSHFDFFSRLTPGKFAYNLMFYFELPAAFYQGTLFPKVIYGLTLPFFALGIHQRFKQDHHYLSYTILSLVLFVLWPPAQGFRFIVSLIPFYLYFTFHGLAHAEAFYRQVRHLSSTRPWLVRVFSVAVLCQFLMSASVSAVAHTQTSEVVDGPYRATSQAVFDLVRQTPEDATIVFHKPRTMDLMTDRLSLRVFNYDEMIEGKGDYLVYQKGQAFGQITSEEVSRLRQTLPVMLENEDFVVLDLRPLHQPQHTGPKPAD